MFSKISQKFWLSKVGILFVSRSVFGSLVSIKAHFEAKKVITLIMLKN